MQHSAWWRSHSSGYTLSKAEAGLYEEAKAFDIVRNGNWRDIVNEALVPATEESEVKRLKHSICGTHPENTVEQLGLSDDGC